MASTRENKEYVCSTILDHIILCPLFREITVYNNLNEHTLDSAITFQCSCGFRVKYFDDEMLRQYGVNTPASNKKSFDIALFEVIKNDGASVNNSYFMEFFNDYKLRKDVIERESVESLIVENELKKRIELVARKMRNSIFSLEI